MSKPKQLRLTLTTYRWNWLAHVAYWWKRLRGRNVSIWTLKPATRDMEASNG